MKSFEKCKIASILVSVAFGIPSLADAQDTETVGIGVAVPLTGVIAHIGQDVANGAKLAVDEANAKGLVINGKKVTLKVIEENDAADPRTATQVAQKLVDDKVVAVIGHVTSGTTIPASKIYSDAGITQITPSATNPLYTAQGFRTTYRLIATDAQQAPVLATYAGKKMGAKTVAIVDDATAYGQGLADEFAKDAQSLGIKVISRDSGTDKTIDWKSILTKIKSENPDIIMYGGEDGAGAYLVRQAGQLGLSTRILSGDGMCTEKLGELAGEASKNLTCSEASLPIEQMPGGKGFKTKYESAFKQPMQPFAPFAYDAVNVVIDSMRRMNSTDPARILAGMPSTNYTGVIGPISFDPKGDLKNSGISLYKYKDGKKELLEVAKL
nr:branched-chain amino acid ABC transporter substrate-binding protein [Paraburkholderia sp. J7]